MSVTELPDIPGVSASPEARIALEYRRPKAKAGYSLATVLLVAVFTLLLAVGASMAMTVMGKDAVLGLFGVQPKAKEPDRVAIALEDHRVQLEQLSGLIENTRDSLAELRSHTDSKAFDLEKLTQRVTTVERFAAGLDQKIADQKKAQQALAQQAKKAVPAKPKPAPIIPVVLVSVRNQGGVPLVSLREGMDTSELLMPGDSWRGWRLLDANPGSKSARFQVAGQVQELYL
jgi:TolA-binding protein